MKNSRGASTPNVCQETAVREKQEHHCEDLISPVKPSRHLPAPRSPMVPLLPQLIQKAPTGMAADAGTAGPLVTSTNVSSSSRKAATYQRTTISCPQQTLLHQSWATIQLYLAHSFTTNAAEKKTNILIICFDSPRAPNTHHTLRINELFVLSPFLPAALSLSWHDFGFSNQKSPEPTGICVRDGKLNSFLHCNQTPHAGKLMSWSEETEVGR